MHSKPFLTQVFLFIVVLWLVVLVVVVLLLVVLVLIVLLLIVLALVALAMGALPAVVLTLAISAIIEENKLYQASYIYDSHNKKWARFQLKLVQLKQICSCPALKV